MARFFKCLSLTLLIFIGYTFAYNRRVFRDFKQKQKEYSIISFNYNGQGQDNNIICQSARCDYKSNTIYNVTNPECGNHYTCQECPPSFGTDICYLGLTSPDWVNITEGHMNLTKHDRVFNQTKTENTKQKKDYEDDYDEDEESFIQTDSLFDSNLGSSFVQKFSSTQSFTYVDHHSDKALLENKKQCQVDKDGNVQLSVRMIFQYYRSPLESGFANNGEEGGQGYYGDEESHIQLGQSCNKSTNLKTSTGTTNTGGSNSSNEVTKNEQVDSNEEDNEESSMLELKFFGEDDDDDGDEYEGNNVFSTVKKGLRFSLNKGSALKTKFSNAVKFLYQKAQVMMSKPEIHFHFVVDDIRIKNCRQPLSWSGEMNAEALIFVGNQNFKLNYDALNGDFLKKGVRVNTSVRGIYELSFNSCLQVHCTKKPQTRLQYVVSPLNTRRESFNISRKLMGLANMSAPANTNQQFVVTTNLPNISNFNSVGLHLPQSNLSTTSTSSSTLTGTPTTTGTTTTQTTKPTTQSGPNTNLPGFNTPANSSNQTQTTTTTTTTSGDSTSSTTTTSTNTTPGVVPTTTGTATSTTTTTSGTTTSEDSKVNAQQAYNKFVGSLVSSEGNKTRFWIFMGVGILIILFLGYFFFLKH